MFFGSLLSFYLHFRVGKFRRGPEGSLQIMGGWWGPMFRLDLRYPTVPHSDSDTDSINTKSRTRSVTEFFGSPLVVLRCLGVYKWNSKTGNYHVSHYLYLSLPDPNPGSRWEMTSTLKLVQGRQRFDSGPESEEFTLRPYYYRWSFTNFPRPWCSRECLSEEPSWGVGVFEGTRYM